MTRDNILASDLDALKDAHRLVRDDTYDEQHCDDWRVRMARRYYNKLYKEYAIIDLTRYKEGKFGLRWRTEAEVVAKKGQKICGSKDCDNLEALCTFELPFKYMEDQVVKRELVKVCVCQDCASMLQQLNARTNDGESHRSKKRRITEEEDMAKKLSNIKASKT